MRDFDLVASSVDVAWYAGANPRHGEIGVFVLDVNRQRLPLILRRGIIRGGVGLHAVVRR